MKLDWPMKILMDKNSMVNLGFFKKFLKFLKQLMESLMNLNVFGNELVSGVLT
jgi:hypothetical protein